MDDRRSVSVLCFAPDPLRVLLLRRPASRAAGWQPVTGRVEPGDLALPDQALLRGPAATPEVPALVAACVREVREETGLPPPREVLDLGIETGFVGYDGAAYRQRHFAARYDDAPLPVETPEHEEARWAGAAEARAILRWEPDKRALDELERRLRPEG